MLALCVVLVVQACDPVPLCHPDEATAKAVRGVSFQEHASWGKTLSHVDFIHLSLYIMGTSQRGSEAQMPTSLRLCHVGFCAVIRLTQPHEEAQGEDSSSLRVSSPSLMEHRHQVTHCLRTPLFTVCGYVGYQHSDDSFSILH